MLHLKSSMDMFLCGENINLTLGTITLLADFFWPNLGYIFLGVRNCSHDSSGFTTRCNQVVFRLF